MFQSKTITKITFSWFFIGFLETPFQWNSSPWEAISNLSRWAPDLLSFNGMRGLPGHQSTLQLLKRVLPCPRPVKPGSYPVLFLLPSKKKFGITLKNSITWYPNSWWVGKRTFPSFQRETVWPCSCFAKIPQTPKQKLKVYASSAERHKKKSALVAPSLGSSQPKRNPACHHAGKWYIVRSYPHIPRNFPSS